MLHGINGGGFLLYTDAKRGYAMGQRVIHAEDDGKGGTKTMEGCHNMCRGTGRQSM